MPETLRTVTEQAARRLKQTVLRHSDAERTCFQALNGATDDALTASQRKRAGLEGEAQHEEHHTANKDVINKVAEKQLSLLSNLPAMEVSASPSKSSITTTSVGETRACCL